MRAEAVDVLIAGAGLAGARCAETLRAVGFDGSVLVAGDEPHPPYERPALSKELLAGTRTAGSLAQRPAGFWADAEIAFERGAAVSEVDLGGRTALVGSRPVRWRHLVLATGARARRLPGIPEMSGVHHLRTLDDATALRADLRPGARIVVIGAGFIGAEVASTACALGLEVVMVEDAPIPLARVLGPEVGARVAARMRAHGVDLRLGMRVARVLDRGGRVRAVELGDGELLPCDCVLVGVGATPNADQPSLSGLARADDGGIATDACGRTEHPGVYACGDVASAWRPAAGRNVRREHWTAAAAGARSVANAVVGVESPDHSESFFWSDAFGWRLQMVGEAGGHLRAEVCDDADDGFLVRYLDGRGDMRGGLAVNRPEALAPLRRQLGAPRRAVSVSPVMEA